MKTPPTGTCEAMSLAMHFLANPRPARRLLPGEELPTRCDIIKPLDFAELELRVLAQIAQCKHESKDRGFCTSCGLNGPGIKLFEEFQKRE